ncbi:hypothetical protein WJX72_010766 [[Myrmecia] bisecta]|uniref:SUN domain-containing protein n=1 Tax=[Myrmecia] bisecta TaxID=41462 RepID=A0AAW1PQP2_9CHLO
MPACLPGTPVAEAGLELEATALQPGLQEHTVQQRQPVAKVLVVELSQFELYSSRVKDFVVRGRQSHPRTDGVEYGVALNSTSWAVLGSFTASKVKGSQRFQMQHPGWVKFLQVHFLSQYGSEPVCAVNDIRVYGKSAAEDLEDRLSIDAADDDPLAGSDGESESEMRIPTGQLDPSMPPLAERGASRPASRKGLPRQLAEVQKEGAERAHALAADLDALAAALSRLQAQVEAAPQLVAGHGNQLSPLDSAPAPVLLQQGAPLIFLRLRRIFATHIETKKRKHREFEPDTVDQPATVGSTPVGEEVIAAPIYATRDKPATRRKRSSTDAGKAGKRDNRKATREEIQIAALLCDDYFGNTLLPPTWTWVEFGRAFNSLLDRLPGLPLKKRSVKYLHQKAWQLDNGFLFPGETFGGAKRDDTTSFVVLAVLALVRLPGMRGSCKEIGAMVVRLPEAVAAHDLARLSEPRSGPWNWALSKSLEHNPQLFQQLEQDGRSVWALVDKVAGEAYVQRYSITVERSTAAAEVGQATGAEAEQAAVAAVDARGVGPEGAQEDEVEEAADSSGGHSGLSQEEVQLAPQYVMEVDNAAAASESSQDNDGSQSSRSIFWL